MEEYKMELRAYGLVPYNISNIQMGIQFGHAKDEYLLKYPNDEIYMDWNKNWKTYVILNGGTTNENPEDRFYGSMQKHRDELIKNDIKFSEFKEPDLNNTLTGVVVIVDERVFRKRSKNNDLFYNNGSVQTPDNEFYYPDFYDYILLRYGKAPLPMGENGKIVKMEDYYKNEYQEWVALIGGPKNLFLRSFFSQFKLAGT
jgi:hypothetical protein